MGQVSIKFPNGPGITFRIDPQQITWNHEVNTSVIETMGGRVVQVTGTTLSDITISGLYGERRTAKGNLGEDHPGTSWRLAREFEAKIREMMEHQVESVQKQGHMNKAAIFTYPPKGWNFKVYIRALADPDGGTITDASGKFSHGYTMTLFIVERGTGVLRNAAEGSTEDKSQYNAIRAFIDRLSNGVGWKKTEYNGPMLRTDSPEGETDDE